MKAHRLVTLTGVGGVGKTRLALEVAERLHDEFPDGVWVFELAAVSDPAAVPDAVAAVLGITQQPGRSVAESVAAALEGRVRLLVFDNCEHVLGDVADLIEAILAHSATVKMLATSREGLGVADEQLWPMCPYLRLLGLALPVAGTLDSNAPDADGRQDDAEQYPEHAMRPGAEAEQEKEHPESDEYHSRFPSPSRRGRMVSGV